MVPGYRFWRGPYRFTVFRAHLRQKTPAILKWSSTILTVTHIYIYMYVCMYVWMDGCMHACMHVCMYVCMYTHIRVTV